MEDNTLAVVGQVAGLVPYTTDQVFEFVDSLVQRAIDEGDPEIAFSVGTTFNEANRLTGLGLARLMFQMKINWNRFKIDVPFEDVAYQYWEIDKANVNRYIRVIEMLESNEIRPDLREQLKKKAIRDLIPIATTFASGYDIPEEKWDTLIEAPNNNAVQEALREIKGDEPRRNSLVIRVERDGTLRAYPGGDFVGYLNYQDRDEMPNVEKAIRRIISSAGLIEE